MSGEGDGNYGDPREESSELIDLLRRYVIQETVDPIQQASRTLLFGSASAICLGIGIVLLLLGVLRILQTETGTVFEGSLSWVPYVITAVLGLAVLGGFAYVLLRRSSQGQSTSNRSTGNQT
jgi:cytochrome c biogenesis protein CcdA